MRNERTTLVDMQGFQSLPLHCHISKTARLGKQQHVDRFQNKEVVKRRRRQSHVCYIINWKHLLPLESAKGTKSSPKCAKESL